MRTKIILAAICCIATVCGAAPKKRVVKVATTPRLEELPRIPVDTVYTNDPDTRIILYSNNTWSYFRPGMDVYNDLPVYTNHWDTTQVFAYKDISLSELPSVVELSLVDSPSEFHTPLKSSVRSKYGVRGKRNHNGVDLALKIGEPIYATFDGKVRYSKYNLGGFGNLVIVRHKNGLETWYAHLSKRNVTSDEYVKAGQIIGYGGSTGRSTGPHLHFEFRYCDQTFDPEFLVDFPTGDLKYETFALDKAFFNIHSRASELLLEEDDEGNSGDEFHEPNLKLLADMGDTTAIRTLASVDYRKKQEEAAQKARIVKAAEEAKRSKYHTVKSGDTLGAIAKKYGVTITQLCKLNSMKTTTTLQLNKKLRVN